MRQLQEATMKKTLIGSTFLALALALASPAMAELHDKEPPTTGGNPPSGHDRSKVNSGVGNGSEYGPDEAHDRDPGRSGAHNRAGNNVDRPNSPRAGTSNP